MILAMGIVGNVENIGLEAAGIKVETAPMSSPANMARPACDGVWAIGDLVGAPWLAHKAMHEGVNFARASSSKVNLVICRRYCIWPRPARNIRGTSRLSLRSSGSVKHRRPTTRFQIVPVLGIPTGQETLADPTILRQLIVGVHPGEIRARPESVLPSVTLQ